MTFTQWLAARSIDCESLTPELKAALLAQWLNELMEAEPPATVLVVGSECRWPTEVYRIATQ